MTAVATRKPGTAVQKEAQSSKLKKIKLYFAFSSWYSSRKPRASSRMRFRCR